MRLLKALVMGMAIMMASQAVMAVDICTGTTTIVCDNSSEHFTNYVIGRLVDEEDDAIVVCANISGTWTQVGIQPYLDGTTAWMEVYGWYDDETVTVVVDTNTTMDCDDGAESEVTGIPEDWFIDGYEIWVDEGDDRITGSDHTLEYLYGEGGDDRIMGFDGVDYLSGGGGADTIWGGDGNDDILGGDGADYLYGDDGVDTIEGGAQGDYIEGNADGDFLYGDDGADYIYGGTGNDEIYGYDGKDWLYGEDGDDIMHGGLLKDRLYGGAGDDDLYGELGSGDICDGGSNNTPVPPGGDYCAPSTSCDTFNGCEW